MARARSQRRIDGREPTRGMALGEIGVKVEANLSGLSDLVLWGLSPAGDISSFLKWAAPLCLFNQRASLSTHLRKASWQA